MIHWSTAVATVFTFFNVWNVYRKVLSVPGAATQGQVLMFWVFLEMVTLTWLVYFIYW